MKENKMNVKWSGEKFEPKNLDLYRLNLRNLNDKREVFFKRVTTTSVAASYKMEIRSEVPKQRLESFLELL